MLQPIVKWAGGKRQIIDEILKLMPEKFDKYYEPFIGGGALFLQLEPAKAFINDFNSELVYVYRCLKSKKNFALMFDECKKHEKNHSEEYYYKVRDMDRKSSYKKKPIYIKAARCLYLNKACFNGLYRVNAQGFFNVPFNGKDKVYCFDDDNIKNINSYFLKSKPHIFNRDFEKALPDVSKGDFVYFDPPYDVVGEQSFTTYTKNGFGRNEQVRLFNLFKSLSDKGVYVMLSNANTPFIRDLYKEFNIHIVNAIRRINSKADKRGNVEEVIITNY